MTRARNTQYAKFWKANSAIDPLSGHLASDKQVARLINDSRERAFLLRRYERELKSPIRITHDKKEPSATYWVINIPTSSYSVHVIARQIAHLIFYRSRGQASWAWHGPEFCAIYVDVVQALMGKPVADILKASFAAHKVRYRPKKKVTATPEMIARLAAARAKKGIKNVA